jgi:hypothetical protein
MSLIYIKHPLQSCNESQEKTLATCDESEQLYHALMFNYGNAAYRYHQVEPTQEEYEQWLEGLSEIERNTFEERGFEENKLSFPLKRFANEMRDNGMDKYMKNLLKPEDYEAIKEIGKNQ